MNLKILAGFFLGLFFLNCSALELWAQATGSHPRLFMQKEEVAQFRQKITTTHKLHWERLVKVADTLLGKAPTVWTDSGEGGGEQLWQRDVGNTISTLSFVWLLSGERKYLEAAVKWATASCSYPTWGIDPKTKEGKDHGLAYGHQLLGLAMLYDYAFSELPPETRKLIRDTLVSRGSRAYNSYRVMEHAYLQNHTWINSCGIMAAAMALGDEVPETNEWLQMTRTILGQTNQMLSPDGASQEGVGYWEYGTTYLLKMMHLSRQLFGEDDSRVGWWKNTSSYALYLMTPRNSWTSESSLVDLADCRRYSWYGPDYQLRELARSNRDGTAQWLADEVARAGVNCPTDEWLNLLWYDPSVKPAPPVATLKHFDNMGIVSSRSDWSGNEALVVFKCGAPLGKHAVEKFPEKIHGNDLGHVHPDAAHFTVFAEGEWQVRNMGYIKRQTEYHNTLLIDGQGQWGQQKGYFKPWPLGERKFGVILEAKSTKKVDSITGDATDCYPSEIGLKKFVRRLIFIKPSVLVVVDEIELDRPRQLSLLFHPEFPPVRQEDGSLLAQGKQSVLRIKSLISQDQPKVQEQAILSRHPDRSKDAAVPLIVLDGKTKRWRTAVAFSWAPVGGQPPEVTIRQKKDTWELSALSESVELKW